MNVISKSNRSQNIPILRDRTPSSKIHNPTPTTEYSLKQNLIDPTKSSPPNEFMLKLRLRMSTY